VAKVEFSKEKVDELVDLLNERWPHWQGFFDRRFIEEETSWKRKKQQEVAKLLDRDQLQDLLGSEEYDQFLERMRESIDPEIIWNRIPELGDAAVLYREISDKAELCSQLFKMLYGPEKAKDRLAQYLSYTKEIGLPLKVVFPTYFFWILHPEEEMVVKPEMWKWFLGLVGVSVPKDPVKLYEAVKECAGDLKRYLSNKGLGPSDMIDVQSFVFMSHWAFKRKEQYRVVPEFGVWFFRVDPDLFDIGSAVKRLRELVWAVTSDADKIHFGDTVCIWRSGADPGIIAVGHVVSGPEEMEILEEQNEFVMDSKTFSGTQTRVRISVDKVLDSPLGKEELRADPVLSKLKILANVKWDNFFLGNKNNEEEGMKMALKKKLMGEQVAYFIFKTKAGSRYVRDEEGKVYHYRAGIPGYRQVKEGDLFVYYDLDRRTFVGAGRVVRIHQTKSDGATEYLASIDRYHKFWIERSPSQLGVTITQPGIQRIPREIFERIAAEGLGFDQGVFTAIRNYLSWKQRKEWVEKGIRTSIVVREVLEALKDRPRLTASEFDAVYLMTIWSGGFSSEKKKQRIQQLGIESSVKDKLIGLIDDRVGCWGTGVFSPGSKLGEEGLKVIWSLFKDLMAASTTNEKLDVLAKYISKGIRGVQAGILSNILYCLEPNLFPVINNGIKAGAERWLKLKLSSSMESYIGQMEKMLALRDLSDLSDDLRDLDTFLYREKSPRLSVIEKLQAFVASRGFSFPQELLANYFTALRTKPFVILTGISGTGKTKLAQLFAEFMTGEEHSRRHVFVSVRSDWSDSRGLLGFYNPIRERYEATETLKLLIRAHMEYWRQIELSVSSSGLKASHETDYPKGVPALIRVVRKDGSVKETIKTIRISHGQATVDEFDPRSLDPEDKIVALIPNENARPYFVILDEMNLAKVEYYFSDFLSTLESRTIVGGIIRQEPLALHDQPGEERFADETGEYSIPPRLEVPPNVYFTGTVNVDETTYMFSPKVLDRANTIEFTEVDLEHYATVLERRETEPTRGAEDLYAGQQDIRLFTNQGKFVEKLIAKDFRVTREHSEYYKKLRMLSDLLQPYNLHFGYRVIDEILCYLDNAQELAGKNGNHAPLELDTAFDLQILQKILPKFHGNRNQLEVPLAKLLRFSLEGQVNQEIMKSESLTEILPDALWKSIKIERKASTPDSGTHAYETSSCQVAFVSEEGEDKAVYPRSAAKLYRMLRKVREQGFVSYIE